MVVDWRAPISALFYNGKLGEVNYKAPLGEIKTEVLLKRQYVIKKGILQGFFDSALDVKDEILQMVLSSNSSEKLKDIVMTIQSEQDEIIRQPLSKTTVVNGVAGSGKTTIALHRVAYLLYNFRDTLENKVMILGPNGIFMEYISTVLPSLGEVGAMQRTFNEYAASLLAVDDIMPFKAYIEKIMAKDSDFINRVLYKQSKEFIKVLDDKIEELNNSFFEIQDIRLDETLVINKDEIVALFEDYKDMPLFRRSKKLRRIIFRKIKDIRDEKVWAIQRQYNEKIASLSKHELELNGNEIDFSRRNAIRDVIRKVLDTKAALSWLEPVDVMEIYRSINGDEELTQDDLAPMLYLKVKVNGRDNNEVIKHVVIDEAQDYSLLQFMVIKMITGCKSMTIVGDANQRMIPYEDKIAMAELENIYEEFDIQNFYLDKSYRSTQQIMEYANKFIEDSKIIPLVREGHEVQEKKCTSDVELLETLKESFESFKIEGYETIAVVVNNMEKLKEVQSIISGKLPITAINDEDMIFSGGSVLIPLYYAKGLEFDAVIVINDGDIALQDKKLNYITCTRALHQLCIINRA